MSKVAFVRSIRWVVMSVVLATLYAASGTGTVAAANNVDKGGGVIYYNVSPAQAGLTQFTTIWIKGEMVKGVCHHTMQLQNRSSEVPLIIQQIAYNPATCSDLVREGHGPGLLSRVHPDGSSSSGYGCDGFNEIYTTWWDPVGINISAVRTCISDPSTCFVGDLREWYSYSGWTEVSDTLGITYNSNWCYGKSYNHMYNRPFCGGTNIYYNPNTYGQDLAGDEYGNPNTWATGCDTGLLHYTWELDPGGICCATGKEVDSWVSSSPY